MTPLTTAVRTRIVSTSFACAALLAGSTIFAQAPPPREVAIDVLAVDHGAQPVPDLTASDFKLRENGKSREVLDVQYVRSSDEPRTTVLLVDDLALSAESFFRVRQALVATVNQPQSGGDRLAILRTGHSGKSALTQDKKELLQSIDHLSYNAFERGRTQPLAARSWSALASLRSLETLAESLGRVEGRKSIVFLSDSLPVLSGRFFDPAVSDALDRAVAAANRSSVVIYAIDAHGLGNTSGGFGQILRESGLQSLADATGGALVRNSDVEAALQRLLISESGHYVVRYRTDLETPADRARDIDVQVTRHGVTTRTRHELFVPAPVPQGPSI